ncbi:malto-oligosyltrehalose trehalohydrolase [bacterium]|nr:malto-oligosyltrehalose trehalohydrolase [bacterium]
MRRVSLWAPHAKKVEVEIDGTRASMARIARGMTAHGIDGWWAYEDERIRDGSEYVVFVDGDGPIADPRSRDQPRGVFGPSRVRDIPAIARVDAGFRPAALADALIYEMHIGTFTPEGTFDAAIARLDHLVDLGATHAELMPVNQFSGPRGWGYDGVFLFAPHDRYGGPDGLARFVAACHERNIGVILDVVYNHLGPEGNVLHRVGPYFTHKYKSPWGDGINFDGPGSDEVRRFVIDNALMWLGEYGIDALRIDAVHGIFDQSATHILEQLAIEVDDLAARSGRRLDLICESDLNDPRLVRPREQGGFGLAAQWNDDYHHALHAVLTGERTGYYADFGRLADIARALERNFVYDGRASAFRERTFGRDASDLPGDRFVGFIQNHDQIGNRARGDRLSSIVDVARVKIGAALVFAAPFTPMVFQGEEWGASTPFPYFTSHQDKRLARAVSKGRRNEFAAFGWNADDVPDPQDEATFRLAILDWDEMSREPHRELYAWYRDLARLRRDTPDLRDVATPDIAMSEPRPPGSGRDVHHDRRDGTVPNVAMSGPQTQSPRSGRGDEVRGRYRPGANRSIKTRFDENEKWLAIQRGTIGAAVNFADEPRAVPLPGAREILLASLPGVRIDGDAIQMPPTSVAFVSLFSFRERS